MRGVALGIGVFVLLALTLWAFQPRSPDAAGPPGQRVSPGEVYDPVTAGESLPSSFRQLLPRDGIAPIYEPVFVDATQIGWPDEAQVIGVSGGGEAKAYPVSHLNRREMVIDEIGGDPILVSW